MYSMMELYKNNLIESFALYTLNLNSVCLESKFYITNYGKTVNSAHNILAVNSAYFSATTSHDLKIFLQISNKVIKDYNDTFTMTYEIIGYNVTTG